MVVTERRSLIDFCGLITVAAPRDIEKDFFQRRAAVIIYQRVGRAPVDDFAGFQYQHIRREYFDLSHVL